MSNTERYATVVESLAAILAVLGLWMVVAPVVLPGTEFVLTHVVVGGIVAAIAAGYGIRIHRDPEAKITSLWFVVVLGVLLLTGALFAHAPGTISYWSTVVTSALVILLALIPLLWGSRFAAGAGEETTIFGR